MEKERKLKRRIVFLSTAVPEEIKRRRERHFQQRILASLRRLIIRSMILSLIPFLFAAVLAVLKAAKGICFLTDDYPVWDHTGLLPRLFYFVKNYLFLMTPIFSFLTAYSLTSWLHRTDKKSRKLSLWLSWMLRLVVAVILAFESFVFFPERSEIIYPVLRPKILFLLEHGNVDPYYSVTVGGKRIVHICRFFQKFSENLKNVEAIGVYTCFSWFIIKSMRNCNHKIQYFGLKNMFIVYDPIAHWNAAKDFYFIIFTNRIPSLEH